VYKFVVVLYFLFIRFFLSASSVAVKDVLFVQENMSVDEINVALHTDSRHADRLRSLYASPESVEKGFVAFKRIDFLGSRRSFEALKRLSRENNSNVYELVIRA
jgi:hypothetical protein